ncbi:MAG: 4Fe-4S dicluster domain-containing protein [Bacteroidetes bacterium]|nr:4Fe-4S dicluster domain-containing protein [Bacteroidota bacterium]MCL5738787.1 4Fe-4S dicluster domain-containing protein [Bacteroidota bacterium]
MAKYGMVIDLNKCTSCQACVTACKLENNVQIVSPDDASEGRTMFWMKMLTLKYEGDYPNVKPKAIPRNCMQCDEPPCIKVCPVRATYKTEVGIVAQIYPQCIGCRYCMANCPYTVKVFNWYKTEQPKEVEKCDNPDVSVRPKGVVEKCTFCVHRLQIAEEKAKAEHRKLQEGDYVPACVEVCPAKAIYFGDLDDTNSDVSKASHDYRAFGLLEELGTIPKVRYLNAIE